MIEDDTYRMSSQYRLWSYSPEQLHNQRVNTNHLASEKVRAAVSRARLSSVTGNGNGEQQQHKGSAVTDIETLTVDEELQIVRWGCQKILDMKNVFDHPLPSHVIVSILFVPGIDGIYQAGWSSRSASRRLILTFSRLYAEASLTESLWPSYSQQQFNTSAASTSLTHQ